MAERMNALLDSTKRAFRVKTFARVSCCAAVALPGARRLVEARPAHVRFSVGQLCTGRPGFAEATPGRASPSTMLGASRGWHPQIRSSLPHLGNEVGHPPRFAEATPDKQAAGGTHRVGESRRHKTAPAAHRRGMTLLEVLLSLTLIILMMSGIFGFYNTVLRVRQEGSVLAQDVLLTRAILDRIADEIRHATDIVPGDGVGFRGDQNSLTIVRHRMTENYSYIEFDDTVVENMPAPQLDLIRIKYELREDPEEVDDEEGLPIVYGLFRSEQKVFDPNPEIIVDLDPDTSDEQDVEDLPIDVPPVTTELYAPEIKYLRFQYFDGTRWLDQWQTTDEFGGVDMGKAAATGKATYALPQAVMITLGRTRATREELELAKQGSEEEEENEIHHPDRFTIVVHVLQSDPSLITSRKYGVTDQLGRSSEE